MDERKEEDVAYKNLRILKEKLREIVINYNIRKGTSQDVSSQG